MSAYSDKVIADGATNYWRLNETAGTSAVDVVGAKHGTISGGVTLNQAGALSDGDKAMVFNGTTGKIVTSTVAALLTPFTVEMWIRRNSTAADQVLFCNSWGTGDTLVILARPDDIFAYTGAAQVTITFPYNTAWHHVVWVFAHGAAGKCYIDGTVYTNEPTPISFTAGVAHPIELGFNQYRAYFNGSLDDIAIYPRALTPAEISAHYTLGVTPLSTLGRDYNSVLAAFLPGTGDLTTEITAYLATLTGDMNTRWKQMEKNAGLSL